jgi:manganese/zinc/iron transport system substrate-binding protein
VPIYFILLSTWFFFALGCGRQAPSASSSTHTDRVQILTTTQMIADAIRPHLTSKCSIVVLFPKGIDPHSYRPVPSDIQLLQQADAIIYSGLKLEANMESMFLYLKTSKPCINLSSFIPDSNLIPIDAHEFDPHIWFNIPLFGMAAKKVADSIGKAISPSIFIKNQGFLDSLSLIDSLILQSWKTLPEADQVLCSVHDAFSYYCQKYNLKQVSLQGVSTVAEFGIYEVDAMVQFLVKNKVKVAFSEAHAQAKTMKAIQLGCKQKGHKLHIGPPLLTDAPGKPGSLGESWPGMVLENTAKIQTSLGYD